ncbi:uracil phosphoribosyltransferase [Rothia dentocariosa]|uniref:uracil phosphoribosyltransferase n=1 Tax=Rothia dentocariosa TaxID=2047 RepID=UPI001455BF9C|nr:uracil phosphoribosyltransferase [Rothia dentocariosa]NLR26315.1 uracil phosphoribosyltransferase [Rothia dentocariosa]
MSTDKNFSTADNNDPQPPVEKQSASNNPENSQQEPKYTQLYGLESTDGKMSLDPQASPEPQGAEGKEEPHKHISQQFDIDPDTREPLLIAQAIRNVLIIIPVLIMLVVFVCVFINVLVSAPSGYDDLILAGMFIIAVIALPYMIHVILQVVAFMRFRRSVKFRWIRGANIYGLIVAPISEVTYVPFMLERILDPSSSAGSSFTIVGFIAALYEIILGISMIVVMTNSIKKTEQPLEQKQHEVSEGVPDESL